MAAVTLNPEQQETVVEIKALVSKLKEWDKHDRKDVARWHDELAEKAHQLHMQLKASGNEPRHHRYMIQNRGVPPTDPTFYRHIHPVEDLLAFLTNMHANDDKESQTIGADFTFRVFSRLGGHDDVFRMKRTATGWRVENRSHNGECDRKGNPVLYENFRQDGINYPEDLPNYFERLWEQADEQGLTQAEVQRELDRLARWVSICEVNTPGGVFEGYSGQAVTADAR